MLKAVPVLALLSILGCAGLSAHAAGQHPVRHVLLISIDGLHQSDLAWFVRVHPRSTLAQLVREGIEYTDAVTPFPSDSFPGMVGQLTGGNPKSTGIYYDDAYSRNLLPPGTTHCASAQPGSEVHYAKNIDRDPKRLDAGQGISGLYDHLPESFSLISALSSHPGRDLINPALLPVDPRSCQPLYPHQYLKVNTVFEVAHARGLHTAWSDKHPSFEILGGPSGRGVDDLFTPEVNSASSMPPPSGRWPDFASDLPLTERYDGFKVQAVLNWINGHDHAGQGHPGEPAIFGMNFQSVSAAQRSNSSRYHAPAQPGSVLDGLGGYTVDAQGELVPGPVLAEALVFVDHAIGTMVHQLNMTDSAVIISARHGQSPIQRSDLTIIDDDALLAAVNAAWKARSGATTELVAHAMDDDCILWWLTDRSQQAADFAARFLLAYHGSGVGSDRAGKPVSKSFSHAGLQQVYAGTAAAAFIGVPHDDSRVPDVIGIAGPGSLYAGARLIKIAEHGGDTRADRHVALLIAGAGIRHQRVERAVETTQIAPTILALLHLDPEELQAVRMEGTRVLPGL